ncbi:MAG: PadR family transcriptional regulator [Hyphomicrobiales bacterium]|nr:PadR family transcriptional regulator [Hyphomicrobiales bacterium]
MNVRTLCLSILYSGDATGYEIRKTSTEGKYAYFVDASYGAIYPALARLESDGRVTSREEVHPGKPARKIYSITDSGRQELIDALKEAPSEDIFRSEFLLVATFAPLLGQEHISRTIDDRIAWFEQEIEKLQSFLDCCEEPASCWTIEYGLNCYRTGLDYLRQRRHLLEAAADTEIAADPEPAAAAAEAAAE